MEDRERSVIIYLVKKSAYDKLLYLLNYLDAILALETYLIFSNGTGNYNYKNEPLVS